MTLLILTDELLSAYKKALGESPIDLLNKVEIVDLPVDYFEFYKSVSSVYSSKIEGEDIDFDSFFKHKFMHVEYKPDYTKKADDLYSAYDFIEKEELNLENVRKAHAILGANLLPKSQLGLIRTNPMFVINSDDWIDYVAATPDQVNHELEKLFADVSKLMTERLDPFEVFYYASLTHLVFVKIHPFQDGNGRTARLIEKWFLLCKIGDKATGVQLEKNYYKNLELYYRNIKKLGLEYEMLDYSKALDFLLMTPQGIK